VGLVAAITLHDIRRTVGGAALALALALFAVGCSLGGDDASGTKVFETSGVSFEYPDAWPPPLPFTTETTPTRMTISSFPVMGYDGEGDCAPQTAVDQLPGSGALVFILDMTGFSEVDDFPQRPSSFELDNQMLAMRECFGESYEVSFREKGRALTVYVALGPRVSDDMRSKVTDVLESLEVKRQ